MTWRAVVKQIRSIGKKTPWWKWMDDYSNLSSTINWIGLFLIFFKRNFGDFWGSFKKIQLAIQLVTTMFYCFQKEPPNDFTLEIFPKHPAALNFGHDSGGQKRLPETSVQCCTIADSSKKNSLLSFLLSVKNSGETVLTPINQCTFPPTSHELSNKKTLPLWWNMDQTKQNSDVSSPFAP